MMLVEGFGSVIFGVDDHGMYANLRPFGSLDRIEQQCTAKPHAAKLLIDGQPAEPGCRAGWIARQPLGQRCRHINDWNINCGKRVVAGDCLGLCMNGDEAGCDAPADILANLFVKIPVKRRAAGIKAGANLLTKRRQAELS